MNPSIENELKEVRKRVEWLLEQGILPTDIDNMLSDVYMAYYKKLQDADKQLDEHKKYKKAWR